MQLTSLQTLHLGYLGLTFPIDLLIDYIAARAVNLQHFGLTFDFKLRKPVLLDPLIEGCPKFSSLKVCMMADQGDQQLLITDYVAIASKMALERLRTLEITVARGKCPYQSVALKESQPIGQNAMSADLTPEFAQCSFIRKLSLQYSMA